MEENTRWQPTPEQTAIANQRAQQQTTALLPGQRAARLIRGEYDPEYRVARRALYDEDPTSILDDYEEPADIDVDAQWAVPLRTYISTAYSFQGRGVTFFHNSSSVRSPFPIVAMSGNSITYSIYSPNPFHIISDQPNRKQKRKKKPKRVMKKRSVVDPTKRHGAASHCPQHGETQGGLCRPCARRG